VSSVASADKLVGLWGPGRIKWLNLQELGSKTASKTALNNDFAGKNTRLSRLSDDIFAVL